MSNLTSWVPVAPDSDFSIYNLPYGIFSAHGNGPRVGVAIGDQIVDLAALADTGFFDLWTTQRDVFHQSTLNAFIGLGKAITSAIRLALQEMLCDADTTLKDHAGLLVAQADANMHMPVSVGDYTDFYSSIEHATNVGMMFRDPANALLPNWRHIPVGYHGRASSIAVSGTPFHRPKGQVMPKDATAPVFQPSGRLDFELEMAFVVGKDTQIGDTLTTANAEDYIFGLALFNDWSARDIQKWEYVPLGPFLGKNFFSSVSPWIVPLEAFDDFRVPGPTQEPAVLPYLQYEGDRNIDIKLDVIITPEGGEDNIVSRSNFQYMYWNMAQQLTHHTINGCNIQIGDMMASGTISGKDESSYGSMLEIAWAGSKPVTLSDGSTRVFIKDHDTVTMRGYAEKDGKRVGFGEVSNKVLPAR